MPRKGLAINGTHSPADRHSWRCNGKRTAFKRLFHCILCIGFRHFYTHFHTSQLNRSTLKSLRPNPISNPYPLPLPLQNKGEGLGEGLRGRNGIGPKYLALGGHFQKWVWSWNQQLSTQIFNFPSNCQIESNHIDDRLWHTIGLWLAYIE